MIHVSKSETDVGMMLAERKRRMKWSQDPRNTFWSNDKSKFGYRMLERMGWKEGKGLGIEEEGTREHVRVKMKEDCLGLGAKKGRDDDWIEHQDSFDQLLAHLNSQQTTDSKASSDTKATTTKTLVGSATESKRLMYKRFLRSKDLSAMSSSDLDCVLGRKRRKLSDKQPDNEHNSKPPPSEVPVSDAPMASHGITTVTSSKSMKDYFSDKLERRTSSKKTVKSKSLGRTKRAKHLVKN